MDARKTKEYLKCVFELESALYTHQKIMDAYTDIRRKNVPIQPVKKSCSPPKQPTTIAADYVTPRTMTGKMALLSFIAVISLAYGGILLLFIIYAGVTGELSPDSVWNILSPILSTIVGIICVVLIQKEKKAQNELREKKAAEANAQRAKQYTKALAKYEARAEEIEHEYSTQLDLYYRQIAEYNDETSKVCSEFNEIKQILQTNLNKLYAQNIVYAKYRNLVTIATIYEYFDSGRCSELEGPNGAYNMYEGELRSDIIISSLNNILSNLEAIRNNQYTLYRSIENANATTKEMLLNINNAQMLTAYYAKQTAIAASADRYIVGMVW